MFSETVAAEPVVTTGRGRPQVWTKLRSAGLCAAVVAVVSVGLFSQLASAQTPPAGDTAGDAPAEFGPECLGLRCRLVTVASDTDDESPTIGKRVKEFASGADVTFAVQLKNVSDNAITVLGVRYGDSYPTAKGTLNTPFLAPHLFEFRFTDMAGRPIPRAERWYEEDMLVLHGASTHAIPPGDILTMLLRPARFQTPMDYQLAPGSYRVTVRYRGPDEAVLAQWRAHWPDSPQTDAWPHEVDSNPVELVVAEDPQATRPPQLVWGPAKDGLQAALELLAPEGTTGNPMGPPGVPVKSAVRVVFHVRNVGDKPITFVSETARQDDRIQVTTDAGQPVEVRGVFFTGWPIDVRWNLTPGDVARLTVLAPGLESIHQPGKYLVRYTIRFDGRQMKDAEGNVVFPRPQDWQSTLETGSTPLFLRGVE